MFRHIFSVKAPLLFIAMNSGTPAPDAELAGLRAEAPNMLSLRAQRAVSRQL
jgi:hypothetical protein